MPFPSETSVFFLKYFLCLNDETKHSALGGAEHFFTFFCCTGGRVGTSLYVTRKGGSRCHVGDVGHIKDD